MRWRTGALRSRSRPDCWPGVAATLFSVLWILSCDYVAPTTNTTAASAHAFSMGGSADRFCTKERGPGLQVPHFGGDDPLITRGFPDGTSRMASSSWASILRPLRRSTLVRAILLIRCRRGDRINPSPPRAHLVHLLTAVPGTTRKALGGATSATAILGIRDVLRSS